MSSHLTRAIAVYEHRIRIALARHIPCSFQQCVDAGGHCATCRDESWPCATHVALTGGQAEDVEDAAA